MSNKEKNYHKYNSVKKLNFYHKKFNSSSNNNLMSIHCLNKSENSSRKRESKSNNRSIDTKYKKELFKKFYVFLKKKKFKISKKFNAKNSKKFLETKDKCLERIILSDIIEDKNNLNYKKKYVSHKNMHNYYIVITDYDENIKNCNNNNIVNKTKLI